MTSKERMLRALNKEKPDRLPASIHQWQQYHLDKYMGGVTALEAFEQIGLDAAIQYFEAMGQFWIPEAEKYIVSTPQWKEKVNIVKDDLDGRVLNHIITTPEGQLQYKTGGNRYTTWILEYLVKKHEDLSLIEKYMPVAKLNKDKISKAYDEVGDAGILRGFVWGDQAGCWQHACCLMDVNKLILEAMDNPDWVHRFMKVLLEKKLHFIEESLDGAKFDLVETGGGASSDTLISPKMHEEFCMPYDRQIHRALHRIGHISTYHTCGGMMGILDLILQNETDASETLSPPGVGGNIAEPDKVQKVFSGKVAMIGGMDQFNILTIGSKEDIENGVRDLFETYGKDGGYIMSACDHFFETSVENLKTYAKIAKECVY